MHYTYNIICLVSPSWC